MYDKSYLESKTTMTSGEWTCLISFATAPLTCTERGGSEKFKMKIYVSSGIRTHTLPVHDRKVAAPYVHSPEVIVVLDPRYDLSYKALYISTCSIALTAMDLTHSFLIIEFYQSMTENDF